MCTTDDRTMQTWRYTSSRVTDVWPLTGLTAIYSWPARLAITVSYRISHCWGNISQVFDGLQMNGTLRRKQGIDATGILEGWTCTSLGIQTLHLSFPLCWLALDGTFGSVTLGVPCHSSGKWFTTYTILYQYILHLPILSKHTCTTFGVSEVFISLGWGRPMCFSTVLCFSVLG